MADEAQDKKIDPEKDLAFDKNDQEAAENAQVLEEIEKLKKEIDEAKNQPRQKENTEPQTQSFKETTPVENTPIITPRSTVSITNKPNINLTPRSSVAVSNSPRRRNRRGGVLTSGAKSLGKNAAKKGTQRIGAAVLSNPWVLIAIGVALAIVGLFLIIFIAIKAGCEDPLEYPELAILGHITGICDAPFELTLPDNPPGITTEKEGPAEIANGEAIQYTLKVSYDPSIVDAPDIDTLYVFDVPLYENTHVDATRPFQRLSDSEGTSYYRWKLSDFADSTDPAAGFDVVLTLTVQPVVEDYLAVNALYVSTEYTPVEIVYTESVGGSPDGPSVSSGSGVKPCGSRQENDIWYGADCLPTKNYCGGKYRPRIDETIEWLSGFPNENPVGSGGNFGDPLCSYRKAKADNIIDELESNQNRANFWKDIVSCEGGVNSYGRQIHPTTGRPWGPAGMFQMNIGRPIFSKWSPSGSLLRGDVPWQRQIQNAIRYNNNLRNANNDFGFWGSAMCLCWWPEYRSMGYCADIVAKGIGSTTGPRAPATNCPTGPGYLSCNTAVKCTNQHCISLGRQGPSQ